PPWGIHLFGNPPFVRKNCRLHKKTCHPYKIYGQGIALFFTFVGSCPTQVHRQGRPLPYVRSPLRPTTRRFLLFLHISQIGTVPLENICKKLNEWSLYNPKPRTCLSWRTTP